MPINNPTKPVLINVFTYTKIIHFSVRFKIGFVNLEAETYTMNLLTILGPTAIGKTKLAALLASELSGEIISADSRQVYQGMDIGTGKDLDEYTVKGKSIPYHLIDIKKAGEEYNVFDFQQDFYKAYTQITLRRNQPILCGGTGLYLEAALASNKMIEVPRNSALRKELAVLNQQELNLELRKLEPELHNETDSTKIDRTIRAIEILTYKKEHPIPAKSPVVSSTIIGLKLERTLIRERIEIRLNERLTSGMIEEVECLIRKGLSHEKLFYYGLEYRFISKYLRQEMAYEEMQVKLLQAIRKFAKKQMTWYRRMEKKGQKIHWIDAGLSDQEKLNQALNLVGI